ncbi:MAG: hypothetical protein C5B50_14705 [Verrucomicrobia bacterium]|nr:MAG: hypothetical protein C5B50_14705 [Verrucomicrobiota bacterium]
MFYATNTTMKHLLRIAAVLSFLCFGVGGLTILGPALSEPKSDSFVLVAVALFFIGTAVFLGAMLLAAAERFGQKDQRR